MDIIYSFTHSFFLHQLAPFMSLTRSSTHSLTRPPFRQFLHFVFTNWNLHVTKLSQSPNYSLTHSPHLHQFAPFISLTHSSTSPLFARSLKHFLSYLAPFMSLTHSVTNSLFLHHLAPFISLTHSLTHSLFLHQLAPFISLTHSLTHSLIKMEGRYLSFPLLSNISGRLHCLVVACWITDHCHSCSNLGVGISEGCLIFDFASLHLEIARPI